MLGRQPGVISSERVSVFSSAEWVPSHGRSEEPHSKALASTPNLETAQLRAWPLEGTVAP